MSRTIKQLLRNDEPLFMQSLHLLEKSSGDASIDVRLIADITHSAHIIMRQLGLSTQDTTPEELYNALKASVRSGLADSILEDSDYVLLVLDNKTISFNMIDVVENSHHDLPLDKRKTESAERSLRGELVQRYYENPQTHKDTVIQLGKDAGLFDENDTEDSISKRTTKFDDTSKPYILAVGDIFTDAFIQLRQDEARIDTDQDGSKRLSMPFGSKPPYERVDIVEAVGPSPNAAVSFSRLGIETGLVSFLGDDKAGADSLRYLKKQAVDTKMISIQAGMNSNYYYVLRYGSDRTILVKNEDYSYKWNEPRRTPDWIYLSLLSDQSWQLHQDMLAYITRNPDIKLAFQPGTFHFKWGVEKLKEFYERSYIIVLNREEAVDVTGRSYESISGLAEGLHQLGPKIVVITDGPNGSYASYGDKLYNVPNYPDPGPPLDRTGAGDAFASTIVAALADGKSIETALSWAPINSMNVVQKLGAQAGLLNKEQLLRYLAKAPEDYKVKEIK